VGITSARGGSRGLPPAHLCTSVTCGIVVVSWWRAHECIPGGQGVASSNPAVPTVFRTLVLLIGNESSHDRSHLAPAGRAKHPRRRPPSCRRPPGRQSHSAVRLRSPTGRPTPAHDDDDRHHLVDRLSPHQAEGCAYLSPPTPAHPSRPVAERLKLTDVATLDLRHFTSCAPKHRRPEPPAIDADRAQAARHGRSSCHAPSQDFNTLDSRAAVRCGTWDQGQQADQRHYRPA
jgi:hypothetical protein